MNNLIKRIKRVGFGFRRFAHYRIRVLLYAGRPDWSLLATVTPLKSEGPVWDCTHKAMYWRERALNEMGRVLATGCNPRGPRGRDRLRYRGR